MNSEMLKFRFKSLVQIIAKKLSELKSPQILVFGYLAVILVGTFLLYTPFASADGTSVSFLDALFTATSATCVTGLTVVATATGWSLFGKIVIMMLIQIGGMGFMCIVTMVMVILGKKITLRERLVIQHSLNQSDIQGMVKLVRNVVVGTFLLEAVCAVFLAIDFYGSNSGHFIYCLWLGVFHSISAFNNAGFDILADVSLSKYVGDGIVNIVIMFLIVMGGLGYTVWLDVIRVFKKARDVPRGKNFYKKVFDMFSLHTKVTLEFTLGLIIIGALFFFFAEYTNEATIGKENIFTKILASFFQSVSPRTAGFFTIDQAEMTVASKFMTVILMFIGGSPGGTAGGIKTVTIGVLFACILSVSKGKNQAEIHKRSIGISNIMKALSVLVLNLFVVGFATIALSITESNTPWGASFLSILFEVTSAVGTVGLTLGVTPYLTVMGKLIIILCMFYGRVGPITVAVALMVRQLSGKKGIKYAEEKIFVG